MSKNLTRKGIAFGAIVALGTTLFAGAPASAVGIDNGAVSLAPKTGTEYNVLAGASFELKANFANSAKTTGSYLKFLVEDAGAKSTVGYSASSQYSEAVTVVDSIDGNGTNGAVAGTENLLQITVASHTFKVGDKVGVVLAGTDLVVEGFHTITAVTATDIFFPRIGAGTTDITTDTGTISLVASYETTNTNAGGRGTAASYVFDTKSDTNLPDKSLRLTSTDEDATQTVIVTAWVDNNDNGSIDTTEYQSPARTVKFMKNSEVTSVTTVRPTSVGDATVVADVVFTPTLNGDQLSTTALFANGAAAVVKAVITRPGDTATPDSETKTWSDTTKKWTVTSYNFNASNWTDTYASLPAQRITAATGANDSVSYSVTANVATVVTGAAHGYRVGDKVIVAGVGTPVNTTTAGGRTITAVPTTTSFRYAVETAQESTTNTASTTSAVSNAITAGTILRNTVEAGTVTVQAYLKNLAGASTAFEKTGALASNGVAAKTASAVVIEGVSSATVNTAGEISTGTTTAEFVAKVTDADGAAVAAGVDATITATKSSAGTVTLNGTTVTTGTVVYAKTDANGYVQIALTNSSAANTDTVTLDVTVQGVVATQVTANYNDRVFSIVDLNDPSAATTPARTRAVAEGASYSFDLLVLDQFKAPAGADLRLKAALTGNTESTTLVSLASGKATLVVVDGGLTAGDVTVNLSFQKLTGSTWTDVDSTTYADWAGVNVEDLASVAITYYTQKDALTLNANAANYPSRTTADFTGATTTKALVAVDTRVSNTAPTAVVAAGKTVVSGAVTNASTGAVKSGQVVSISGAGLLFKSGAVWSIGSATQIAADGTFAFEVYSNNPGTKGVTVAVGSVTKTASLVFTGASSAVRYLTISGAQKVLSGSTLQATILLVDGNGNPVDTVAPATTPASEYISVSYAGPGLLSGAALPTETDASGVASIRYLMGTRDRGLATVTVKFDANFDGDFVDATDITVVRNYLVGITAGARGQVNAVSSLVKNANGLTVQIVRGAKSKTAVATSDSYRITLKKIKAGQRSVKVYVNGVLVKSKTVTVTN